MAKKSKHIDQSDRQRRFFTWRSMVGVLVVVGFLVLLVGIKSVELNEKNVAYEKTIRQLEEEIAQEEERAEEIEAYSTYVNSDEYIEKIARERLGLVNENEIIFYSGTEENGGATEAPATASEDDTGDTYSEE